MIHKIINRTLSRILSRIVDRLKRPFKYELIHRLIDKLLVKRSILQLSRKDRSSRVASSQVEYHLSQLRDTGFFRRSNSR